MGKGYWNILLETDLTDALVRVLPILELNTQGEYDRKDVAYKKAVHLLIWMWNKLLLIQSKEE